MVYYFLNFTTDLIETNVTTSLFIEVREPSQESVPTLNTKKECLNSDGHRFHQYQQNEQSSLILAEITEHKTRPRNMTLGNSDIGMGHTPTYGGYTPIVGIPTLPSCRFYK